MAKSSIALPQDAIGQLEAYFALLRKWNAKINLTSLALNPPSDETIDRLFIEPLAAARELRDNPLQWLDLGSGGGSPAVPLKLVRPALRLTMVESKAKKAAFLREAVRTLNLSRTSVENSRFEDLSADFTGFADLVTVRAIRAEAGLFQAAERFLAPGGELYLFAANSAQQHVQGFHCLTTIPLGVSGNAFLKKFVKLFHVEQAH